MDIRVPPATPLLAAPHLVDPNFHRAVVLMCQQDKDGAFGLVVNRESGLTTRDVFPQHPLLSGIDHPVRIGGPVSGDHLQFLHRDPVNIPGGLEITEQLFLGGDFDAMAAVLAEDRNERRRVALYLGYSGWGGGQLEFELTSMAWLPIDPDPLLPFRADDEETWQEALGQLPDGPWRTMFPPDPSMN